MKKTKIFRGVGTALVTPMLDGEIDYPALGRIIDAQISSGVDALIVGGTTGEAATLSAAERCELYTYAKKKTNGRARLILGTGTNDTRTAIKMTRDATDIGCDGILAVTPYYNKGTYGGVVEHYKEIAKSTNLPVLLYNVPVRTGVNLTIKQLDMLAKIPNIVGIKEASDSADRLTELAKYGDELYLYAGNDSQIYLTLALGGEGVISVVSNLLPKMLADMCRAYFDGEHTAALKTQLMLFDFIRLMFKETNPAPIKYAMSLCGLCSPELRLPLALPEKETQEEIKASLKLLEI